MKQGNTARNAKIQFLKMFLWIPYLSRLSRSFPDIVIATAKFPISRYRDDRDLSVCLGGIGGPGEAILGWGGIRGDYIICTVCQDYKR